MRCSFTPDGRPPLLPVNKASKSSANCSARGIDGPDHRSLPGRRIFAYKKRERAATGTQKSE